MQEKNILHLYGLDDLALAERALRISGADEDFADLLWVMITKARAQPPEQQYASILLDDPRKKTALTDSLELAARVSDDQIFAAGAQNLLGRVSIQSQSQ